MSIDLVNSAGDDALTNQFNVIFPTGIPGGGNTDRISLRTDQAVDPPERSINVYEIFHKGIKIPKTGTLDETSKELTFDVRLDQAWGVYDDFAAWLKLCYDFSNAVALPDVMTRTNITIQADDTAGTVIKSLTFKGIKLRGMKIASFDNQTSEPLRLTVNFIWNDFVIE
jgi:hypothetical protein